MTANKQKTLKTVAMPNLQGTQLKASSSIKLYFHFLKGLTHFLLIRNNGESHRNKTCVIRQTTLSA